MTGEAGAPTSVVTRAVAGLLLNALVWGTSWWPFRHLQAVGLHPLWATAVIYAASAGVVAAWRPSALGQVVRSPMLWLLLLAAGTTNAAFNWAAVAGDVVRVVLLFYLAPVWTVLLARLLLGEAVTVAAVVRVALALVGAALLLVPGHAAVSTVPPRLPDLLALLGGFTFALNTVLLRRQAHEPEAARALAMFVGGTLVAGGCAVLLAGRGVIAWPTPLPAWAAPAAMLAALFLMSNLALQFGAAHLPANVTSVIMLSEVLFAAASSWWWGGMAPTGASLVGGACIVGAAALAAFEGRGAAPDAAQPAPGAYDAAPAHDPEPR